RLFHRRGRGDGLARRVVDVSVGEGISAVVAACNENLAGRQAYAPVIFRQYVAVRPTSEGIELARITKCLLNRIVKHWHRGIAAEQEDVPCACRGFGGCWRRSRRDCRR